MGSPRRSWFTKPFQIEALISKNTEIRSKSRCGIRWASLGLSRGILLFVPSRLDRVSPLYLRAQSGQLPELKRGQIAAYSARW